MTLSSSKNEFLIKDGIWKNKNFGICMKSSNSFLQKLFEYAKKEKIKALALHLTKGVQILK